MEKTSDHSLSLNKTTNQKCTVEERRQQCVCTQRYNCSVLSPGNAPRTLSTEMCSKLPWGSTRGDHLFCIHHPKRDSCQTNPYILFCSWPVDSDSTSQIFPGEGCKFDKMPQSNARFRGLRRRPKDLPDFYFLWCKVAPGRPHTRSVLLFISNKQPEPRQPDEDDIWLSNLCQVTAVP